MEARKKALSADLVVVNHHLFFADILLRDEGLSELLPTCDTVIFDEAHYLNDSSRGHVWEKSIILSLLIEDCLLILLSATIGNIDMVMDWLNNINEKRQFKKGGA